MAKRPTDKLNKLEAVMTDRSATEGEKAAAGAAADRVRRRWKREQAEETKAAIEDGGAAYLIGRALGRIRRGGGAEAKAGPGKGVLFALGRAVRKATKKT